MVVTALRGAVGFLTRLPVGSDERAWDAFRRRPYVLPLAGYPVGLVAGLALIAGPAPTAATVYVLAVYAVTGINHVDGLADLGDAVVVHGGPEKRRRTMKDTTLGVGGALAVGLGLLGLGFGALALASLPAWQALGIAIAAEVGAKLSMATLAVGRPTHDGLGAQLLGATPGSVGAAFVVATPAAFLAWPALAAAATVGAGPLVALALRWWARRNLGGLSGDIFGASNELARVVGIHAGVVAWTLF